MLLRKSLAVLCKRYSKLEFLTEVKRYSSFDKQLQLESLKCGYIAVRKKKNKNKSKTL